MIAYKLLRVKANGAITPLFINNTKELPIGEWMDAEDHPTNGYAHRPGWHCTQHPKAPHLSEKGRSWYHVEIDDYEILNRPRAQGGIWFLAKRMRILDPV